jgi:hypothetical protein
MSLFTYNGITIPYPFHTSFQQIALRDEEGDTDQYATMFDIEVMGILNTDLMAVIAPTLVPMVTAGNAASVMSLIRDSLLKPRKRLSVSFNGTQLITNNGLPGTVDSANGPKPQYCNILDLGNTTFLISYKITAVFGPATTSASATYPSSGGGAVATLTGNSVLFNRWEDSVSFDDCQFTTRTRSGTIRIRSDNDIGAIADDVRAAMAVVGVPPGFLRKSRSYSVTPDGLSLKYSITDQEQFKMPPQFAGSLLKTPGTRYSYKAEGEYEESFGKGAPVRFGSVWCRLYGGPTSSQAFLIYVATSICLMKLRINDFQFGQSSLAGGYPQTCGIQAGSSNPGSAAGNTILIGQSSRIDMYRNIVEFRIKVQGDPAGNYRFGGVGGSQGLRMWTNMVFTPGSELCDNPISPPYPDYGLSFGAKGLLLTAARYYDPSIRNQFINQSIGNFDAGLDIGKAGITAEP